ncbi:hypothetical protein [Variovorax saccharolyticus]|uniref:hypothetical protein n=1 Tax=Variovorax saccharolyticus TaxID=3053516 RepID=UPI002575E80A|nr:hypothetical protein [Variovorax sp. J31P216]MDM0030179.1 hypothetical protein [Variovorax sp. J31P216]
MTDLAVTGASGPRVEFDAAIPQGMTSSKLVQLYGEMIAGNENQLADRLGVMRDRYRKMETLRGLMSAQYKIQQGETSTSSTNYTSAQTKIADYQVQIDSYTAESSIDLIKMQDLKAKGDRLVAQCSTQMQSLAESHKRVASAN